MIRNGIVIACFGAATIGHAVESVVQSARAVPVVREADVVVVGGSSAAVAAALAARSRGASVFLVAPRTYLGDDLAGTRELWHAAAPEFMAHSLAQRIFMSHVPFTYQASVAPDSAHPDNDNTRLTDGVQNSASTGSVQYNSDVVITVDFSGVGTITGADLYYYVRTSGTGPFKTEIAGLEYSEDGVIWTAASVTVQYEQQTTATDPTWLARIVPAAPVRARYVRLACDIPSDGGFTRQLLDELIFYSSGDDPTPGACFKTTPLMLKRELELALEESGVAFLGGAPVCDVLLDADGQPSGVVMANRAGRQAVTARVVIDASENAWPARCAGAVMTDFTPGPYSFSRIVLADATDAPSAQGLSVETLPGYATQATISGVAAPPGMPTSVNGRIYRCRFTANLERGDIMELLEIEQFARDLTWSATCLDQADRLAWLPPDHIVGVAADSAQGWTDADALTLDAFRPEGVAYLYVLGVRADISRTLAADLQNPARLMKLADRMGVAAAADAWARAPLSGVVLPANEDATPGDEEVRELLSGLPPAFTNACGTVAEGTQALPVLAECDVLVVGAGTAGAPAAIAAGRAGVDTILMDVLYTMGGVQTDGRIGAYYHGNDCGFSKNEVDPGWQAIGASLYTAKAEWYRRTCRAAGVRVLYGTLANGAVVEDNTVKGVVVVLPDGQRGVIRAKVVIDSTGNADIAAAAGAATEFGDGREPAVQGAGWGRHILGNSYVNSDIGFVNDAAVGDVFYFARRARRSVPASTWDVGQNPATRERRRLVGVVTVTPIDILNNRTWPDTIVRPASNFDSHGFTVHDLFFILDPGTSSITANLPFRALLPSSMDGLLVTGLGISAHRDAMPLLRMQRDVQNQGYAAGRAAAMAVQADVPVRAIDIAALQAHLVEMGILTPASAHTVDNFPLASTVIQQAVTDLTNHYASLPIVLADPVAALPLLRTAYASAAQPAHRLIYAHVLGLLNDATGAETLATAVSASAWDSGWNFRGMGQYGRSVSMMDSYLVTLGRTRDARGIVPLIDKTRLLAGTSQFSHIRAVALAGEGLDGGSVVEQLSSLLTQLRGQSLPPDATPPPIPGYSDTEADAERNRCLKELVVARALYRLGDDAARSGEEVLCAYAQDPREVYAAHARQILADGPLSQIADGTWIAGASQAEWSNAANWLDGVRANGYGVSAFFTNALATPQTISLQDGLQNIGRLHIAGAERTFVDGVLDFSGDTPSITVADGAQATLATDVVSVQPLAKSGPGTAVLAGIVTLGGLTMEAGTLRLSDPSPRFVQAYSTDPSLHNSTAGNTSLSLRTDFRVNRPIMVTQLGAYDSGGDGIANFKKVAIFARTGGSPLAVTAFATRGEYAVKGGFRFHRLPVPVTLLPGEYALVTYGFYNTDRYIEAGKGAVGDMAGTLDDGDGAITFLPGAYSTTGGELAFPTTVLPVQSSFAATAGSFIFAADAAAKQIVGPVTLPADTTLEIGAADVRLDGGLLPGDDGFGHVENTAAAYPVSLSLTVPAGATNVIPAAVFSDRQEGPVTLVKNGAGRLDLQGTLPLAGGLHVGAGVVAVDDVNAIGPGELSFGTGGVFEPRAGGVVDRVIYAPNQSGANNRSTRFVVPSGSTVTFTRGIEAPRAYSYAGFVLQPHDDPARFPDGSDEGMPLTVVKMDGAYLGKLDLYLLGDGLPGSGAALHHWTGVQGSLRKLACGHETVDGCRIVFDTGCNFKTDWFDLAGSNAVVSVTNNADIEVATQLRFVDGNSTQLSLDGGRLRVAAFGVANTDNHHLSLKPVLFNGTTVQAVRTSDVFFNLAPASAAPLIGDGGAIIDTDVYTVAIRGQGFAQAPGSDGAFVKQGSGVLRIATPMFYTGPTWVSNGTLRLDFALASPSNTLVDLLAPESVVTVSGGAKLEILGAPHDTGVVRHRQTLQRLVSVAEDASITVTDAELTVNRLDGTWRKMGTGTLVLGDDPVHGAPFTGRLTVGEGLFAVRCVRSSYVVHVPCSGFESEPLLPHMPNDRAKMDKRGADAAAGCPGWTFISEDAGYQRNDSYFSAVSSAFTSEGVQTAFVRREGAMEVTLNFPGTADYTLKFSYCPRYYSGKWYTNHVIRVHLDGTERGAVVVSEIGFRTATVDLGLVPAGSHVLRFAGSRELPATDNDPCTLVDDIQVSGITDVAGVDATLSSEASALMIESGARVELDYAGVLTVGELMIDGVRYGAGRYDATTHPEIFAGPGQIRLKSAGTALWLR